MGEILQGVLQMKITVTVDVPEVCDIRTETKGEK